MKVGCDLVKNYPVEALFLFDGVYFEFIYIRMFGTHGFARAYVL